MPETNLSIQETRSIFAMRQRYWPNGKKIHVFVLPDNHNLHRSFTKSRLNMFPHQFRRIWDRLIYSGTGTSPIVVHSVDEMHERVSNTVGAIGYSDRKPKNMDIRVFENE